MRMGLHLRRFVRNKDPRHQVFAADVRSFAAGGGPEVGQGHTAGSAVGKAVAARAAAGGAEAEGETKDAVGGRGDVKRRGLSMDAEVSISPQAPPKRRRLLSRRRLLVGAGLLAAGTGLYAWRIEPHWLEI